MAAPFLCVALRIGAGPGRGLHLPIRVERDLPLGPFNHRRVGLCNHRLSVPQVKLAMVRSISWSARQSPASFFTRPIRTSSSPWPCSRRCTPRTALPRTTSTSRPPSPCRATAWTACAPSGPIASVYSTHPQAVSSSTSSPSWHFLSFTPSSSLPHADCPEATSWRTCPFSPQPFSFFSSSPWHWRPWQRFFLAAPT